MVDTLFEDIEYQSRVPEHEKFAWLTDPNRDIRHEMLPIHLPDAEMIFEAWVKDDDGKFEWVPEYKSKVKTIKDSKKKLQSEKATTEAPNYNLVITEEDILKKALEILTKKNPCCKQIACACDEEKKKQAWLKAEKEGP